MSNLEASMMEILISEQEYRKLVNDKERALVRNDELVREVRRAEEKHQILLNEFTKVKEESQELKMQIKDISKQALRINRFHLAKEDQIKADNVRKQEGIVNAQREHRERAGILEDEVLCLRQELDRKGQIIQQLQQKEEGLAATQNEKIPQLEEEVLRLKQELDTKGQTIQQLQQAEAGLKSKLASESKTHLETIQRLKQENTEIVADLISKLEKLGQEKEASTATLKKELELQRSNTLQIKKKLQLKESELQKEKATSDTAYKKIKDLLTSEKKKSQELEERNKTFKQYLASTEAEKEKVQLKLKETEVERTMYKQETQGISSTLNEMWSKLIHSPNVSISMSEGGSFQNQQQLKDTLNYTVPAKMGLLFTTISSISSSSSKQRAEYQQLQERCKALQREKQTLTLQLQEMKGIMERSRESTSFSQSNSSMMKLDKSFAEELKKKESLLQSQKKEIEQQRAKYKSSMMKLDKSFAELKQKESLFQGQKKEIESQRAKYKQLRAKYEHLKKKNAKLTQQKSKVENQYKKVTESIMSLGKF